MGATGIAVASAASANAGVAASRARDAECVAKMGQFQPATATVQQQRDYASCVHRLHGDGEPMDAGAVIGLKVVVLASFVCAAGGAVWGWDEEGGSGAFMGALVGAVAPWFAALVLALAVAGLQFLFS